MEPLFKKKKQVCVQILFAVHFLINKSAPESMLIQRNFLTNFLHLLFLSASPYDPVGRRLVKRDRVKTSPGVFNDSSFL